MSTTDYRNYVDQTMRLANSVVIKSGATAEALNDYVRALGYDVLDDPTTWKYYQNISGEYHFLDQPMKIVSLDTLETISFDRETLELHLNTLDHYRPGTRHYRSLVARHPDQELLIRGIVSSVNKEKAIEASDHTILDWDSDYVDPNETNLIYELQNRVYRFAARWEVPGYHLTDDLYGSAFFGVLSLNLPNWILNIRLKNCRTAYAHSFHIREYLKGRGRLHRFVPFLTRRQRLWLYRNIAHIQNSVGRRETFNWLEENLLSDRGIGLAEYRFQSNISELPEKHHPSIEFVRQALNPYHRTTRDEAHETRELLVKQRDLARNNEEWEDSEYENVENQLKNSPRSTLPVKVLESSMVDTSESGFVGREEFLINHWLYWSATDRYFTILSIPHPRTGNLMDVPVRDAFTMYLYAYNRSIHQELKVIPKLRARFIRRHPAPTLEELSSIVDRRYVPKDLIKTIAKEQPGGGEILSPAGFVQEASRLYEDAFRQKEIYDLQEHQRTRGYVQALVDHLYKTVECPLVEEEGKDYPTWFWENGYDIEDLSREEYATLSDSLIDAATGMSLADSYSTSQIQRAMITIMRQLSSYSVHYVREINEEPLLIYNWLKTRVGDQFAEGIGHHKFHVLGNTLDRVKSRGFSSHRLNHREHSLMRPYMKTLHKVELELRNKIRLTGQDHYDLRLPIATTRFDVEVVE